jgi:hypothetical protein
MSPPPSAAPVLVPPRPVLVPGALASATVEDYRRRARYPRSSQPLAEGEDPIVRDREVTPIRQRGPRGEDPTLEVFPARPGFESPEAAVLHAALTVGGRRVPADEMRATVLTEALAPVGVVDYRDDGKDGDVVAGDRLYTAVFTPGPQPVEALARSYLVKVVARTRRSQDRTAATSFLYSTPHAYLTGNFRDAVVDGSLTIDAEVEVALAGRFHLEATLYSGDGSRPLAWSQTAGELAPGRHWMTLAYYGLILNERQVDGPYLLRWVALSTATGMPNAKNRPLENAWMTRPYRASAFSDRPFDDPDLLDAAERIERDAAKPGGLEAGG